MYVGFTNERLRKYNYVGPNNKAYNKYGRKDESIEVLPHIEAPSQFSP